MTPQRPLLQRVSHDVSTLDECGRAINPELDESDTPESFLDFLHPLSRETHS